MIESSVLSLEALRALTKVQSSTSVSMYMPVIRKGSETQQNQIRYKNLLRKAEEGLSSRGLKSVDIKKFMQPAHDLLGDIPFWRKQSEGLAVFISSEDFHFFKLREPFDELVVVTDRFHLKPLIPIMGNDMTFYILAVSQKAVRFIECTKYTAKKLDMEGLPRNLSEALNLDTVDKRLQLHTGTEDNKGNILQYFQLIDRGLREFMKGRQDFLLFAGVDYLFPLYREANTYPHLLDVKIPGNPDELSTDEIHGEAIPIIDSYLSKERAMAADNYMQNAGTGLTSYDLKDILENSHHGRIGVLFVPVGVQRWGSFDAESKLLEIREKEEAGDEDLFDLAAIKTLLSGGKVYAVKPSSVPGNSEIAALMRY